MNELAPFSAARQPPANLEAEQALLGAILASNRRAYEKVCDFLRPEHFADPLHGRIYAEAERRILAGGVADAVSLRTWFATDAQAGEAGPAYLGQLLASHVGILNVGEYGKAVRDCWQRRRVIEIAEDVAARAYAHGGDAAELVSGAIASLDQAIGLERATAAVSIEDAADAALRAAEEAGKRDGPPGLSTGFRSIDARLDGLENGNLNILAARPGMGKTALAVQIAIAAARAGHGVSMSELEMSGQQIGRRVLSTVSGVPLWRLKRGALGAADAEALVRARSQLRGLPLSIDDRPAAHVRDVDLAARRAKRKHGLRLIVVDHLSLIAPDDGDKRQSSAWMVGRISGGLKALAKRHECPVLALCQLNRGVENRDDRRPGLRDLRESGAIEQDADTVSFLYRPEYYERHEPERGEGETTDKYTVRVAAWRERRERLHGVAELIVEKVRDGAPGTVPLRWCGETTSFSEVEQ